MSRAGIKPTNQAVGPPHPLQAILAALALAPALACQAPDPRPIEEMPIQAPDAWAAEAAHAPSGYASDTSPSGEATTAGAPPTAEPPTPLGPFWLEFEDAGLRTLVTQALTTNHDLAAAAARVHQAAAQARIAGAALWPSAGAGLNRSRQRQNFVGFPIGGGDVLSTTTTAWGLSLDLSWELDLWGKLDAGEKAAAFEATASAADWRAARLSLAGQTTKAWLAHVATLELLRVAEARVASFTQTSEVLRQRYENGRVDALDFRLSESQLASATAARDRYLEALERSTRQLELLAGDYPAGTLETSTELPPLPAPVPAGLPSELLQRRPDLVAVTERLRAADMRLFEARRQLWPSFSLTGGVGRRSEDFSDLGRDSFDVWNLVGNLTQPIFQGGRLRAGVDRADARVSEALETYSSAVLAAFGEVETALAVAERHERIVAETLEASEHAKAGEAIAESRYLSGRTDILSVLTARRQSFDAESAWVEARRAQLDARIDLYLALGGGFEDERALSRSSTDPTIRSSPTPNTLPTSASDLASDSDR